MPKVVHTAFGEGLDYAGELRRRGVEVRRGAALDASAGFQGRHATVYSYASRQLGGTAWLVDVQGYEPPDIAWGAATVLDGPPSPATIEALARGRVVAVGDELPGAD